MKRAAIILAGLALLLVGGALWMAGGALLHRFNGCDSVFCQRFLPA